MVHTDFGLGRVTSQNEFVINWSSSHPVARGFDVAFVVANVRWTRPKIRLFLFIRCVGIGILLHSLNVLNFFEQVVCIFKWLLHLAKLFFWLGNFVSFSSKRLQMLYLQFERSKFPHIATDVEFASLPTLIWLETLLVNFTQETVLVPGVFVLRKQRNFVSTSVFIFMMVCLYFHLVEDSGLELNSRIPGPGGWLGGPVQNLGTACSFWQFCLFILARPADTVLFLVRTSSSGWCPGRSLI